MIRLKENNKGFTLIELVVVMMIIGILVLLAAPRFLSYVKDANVTALQADVKTLSDAAVIYNISEGGGDSYPIDSTSNVVNTTSIEDILEGTIKKITGEKVTDLKNLGLKKLDKGKLTNYIRNTKNPIDDYVLATEGPLAGEVFYTKVLENGNGDKYVHMIPGELASESTEE